MTEKISEITDHASSKDGIRLFYRHHPVENARAGILIAHGLGEHSGRYARLTKDLTSAGFTVFAYDHRGHGQSQGKRGHIACFQEYIDDLEIMIEKFRSALSKDAPFFLLGHSMGGLIALNYAQQHGDTLSGVIASSPGLAPAEKPPAAKVAVARLMSVLMPAFSFDNELEVRFLSHDQKVVDAYLADPLVHRRITARWGVEFMKTTEETMKNANRLQMPILMQVAGDDRLANPEASRTFFTDISSEDKTLRYYEEMYHEIYNETDNYRQQVISDLEDWLNDHI